MNNNTLKEHFDKLLKAFLYHGTPGCFGRLEGFKDFAELTGNKEVEDHIQMRLKEYDKELKALCCE